MALYEINGRMKQKRDTAANWEAKNPVILNGEIVFVDTSAGELRAKIGDGVKKYSQLPFSDEALRNLIAGKISVITNAQIDAICGSNVTLANGVSF